MKKPLDPNDPRFTAKALGENEEQPIPPELQDDFDSLREFTDTLRTELKSKAAQDRLDPERMDAIREKAIPSTEGKLLRWPVWLSSVAAALIVGVFALQVNNSDQELVTTEIAAQKPLKAPTTDSSNSAIKDDKEGTGEPHSPEPKQLKLSAMTVGQPSPVANQSTVTEPEKVPELVEDELYSMSNFEMEAGKTDSYAATDTLGGTRVRTELRDQTAPLSVVTRQFLQDAGSGNAKDLLAYTTSTEVAGLQGSFGRVDAPAPPPPSLEPLQTMEQYNREAYDHIVENAYKRVLDHPLSTFSIDVDTASYANMRRMLNQGYLPSPDALRTEELINYFKYDYAQPTDEHPFSVNVAAANAPWAPEHRLVRIGLQGMDVDTSERPDANLVFLIDVSGSMSSSDKLGLVQKALSLLTEQMTARDRIALVVYAGASGLVLPSTTANNTETIQHAINQLRAGGSTNGGAGIELAYDVAQKHFVEGGINRVILCTDGDFNVGTSSRGELVRLVEDKAKSGVFFTICGFGTGNYQDATMEELSNKGNGNYAYIDTFNEARKVFVDQMLGTLMTIAKDVKIQVEFNPGHVAAYRLIGYENRALAKEDFNDDTKDAGEIGSGHQVTALYEIIPAGQEIPGTASVDPLKYQTVEPSGPEPKSADSLELLTVKLRYKQPDGDTSTLIEVPFIDEGMNLDQADDDFRFATAVAAFSQILRHSSYSGDYTLDAVKALAEQSLGQDPGGLRREFLQLVEQARALQNANKPQ